MQILYLQKRSEGKEIEILELLWIRGVIPGSKIEKNFLKFFKRDIFRGNFMRKIDCMHY
jgi:hypothetical protein